MDKLIVRAEIALDLQAQGKWGNLDTGDCTAKAAKAKARSIDHQARSIAYHANVTAHVEKALFHLTAETAIVDIVKMVNLVTVVTAASDLKTRVAELHKKEDNLIALTERLHRESQSNRKD
ncbi:MAG: hypothetical protein SGARI_007466 [Bacillariaceae sp.]